MSDKFSIADLSIFNPLYGAKPRFETAEEKTRREVSELRALVEAQQNYIDSLSKESMHLGVVLACEGSRCIVKTGVSTIDVTTPTKFAVEAGDVVSLLPKYQQIYALSAHDPPLGMTATYKRDVNGVLAEVELGSGTKLVYRGKQSPKPGDKVVLDQSNSILVRNLGPDQTTMTFSAETGVTWDDIGGQAEAKAAMVEAIEGPYRHREAYAKFGKRPSKGVLLHGPPGNGKTMLGKAAASAIAAMHGKEAARTGFIYVKGPELLSKWVGNSEENVRTIFDSAREHKARHGYPAVVFIDEAEAILTKRGTRFSGMEATVVPAFLAEMDGLEDSGAVVLLATNRPDSLDPAVIREGRIDYKVQVGRPDKRAAREVLLRHMHGKPFEDVDSALFVTLDYLYSDKPALYRVDTKSNVPHFFCLKHIVSGAMLANLVDQAALFAMRREIETGVSGAITADDMKQAVDHTVKQQDGITHYQELYDFLLTLTEPTNIERLTPGQQVTVDHVRAAKAVPSSVN